MRLYVARGLTKSRLAGHNAFMAKRSRKNAKDEIRRTLGGSPEHWSILDRAAAHLALPTSAFLMTTGLERAREVLLQIPEPQEGSSEPKKDPRKAKKKPPAYVIGSGRGGGVIFDD